MEKKLTDEEIIHTNENFIKGEQEFDLIQQEVNKIAIDLATELIGKNIKEENSNKYNLTNLIFAVGECLCHLTQFLYDDEKEFTDDLDKAMTAVASDVIPALLKPEPCGMCENCKNGKESECINPKVRTDYVTSRILPLVASKIVSYCVYWACIWNNTVNQENKGEKDNAKTDGNDKNRSNNREDREREGETE